MSVTRESSSSVHMVSKLGDKLRKTKMQRVKCNYLMNTNSSSVH